MTDAILGWDFFRCADYSVVDSMVSNSSSYPTLEAAKSKLKIGHTIIFAVNLGPIKLFKRLFIGI